MCVSWLALNTGNEQAQPWYHSWINWSAVPLFTQLMAACSFLLSGSIRDQIRHCSCPTIAVVAAQKSKIWIMVDLRSSDIEMYKLQGKKIINNLWNSHKSLNQASCYLICTDSNANA